ARTFRLQGQARAIVRAWICVSPAQSIACSHALSPRSRSAPAAARRHKTANGNELKPDWYLVGNLALAGLPRGGGRSVALRHSPVLIQPRLFPKVPRLQATP